MRTRSLLLMAGFAGVLLACGQKGPLVLPDAEHPRKKIGIGQPLPKPPGASRSGAAPSPGAIPNSAPTPTPVPATSPPSAVPAPAATATEGLKLQD